jgi:DNA anti-recombination protein RmuC
MNNNNTFDELAAVREAMMDNMSNFANLKMTKKDAHNLLKTLKEFGELEEFLRTMQEIMNADIKTISKYYEYNL